MCGICGIYNYRNSQEVDRVVLQSMADSIAHRGPNDQGFYHEKNLGLGHRRLSIIDKAGGGQPMFNEDGKICVVFNGEIYNHHPIREELIAKGHVFKTRCDTEAILHLYEEIGESFVERLRGMFALALWDSSRKKLVLARDRVGIKPLLYAVTEKGILFASEMKALLVAGVCREISPKAISDYLTYRYVPAPCTIFKHVQKLLPGYILIATPDGVTTKAYWDLDFSRENTSFPEASEEIRRLLGECVESHLESEVPLGAFLSGGVDSSTVVALMAKATKDPVKTFSIGFEHKSYNETPYARMVASQYKTDHHETIVKAPGPEEIDTLLQYFDEPFADSSSIPTFVVCREAAKNVTVVLSGDGGDENFGGYRRYFFDLWENKMRSFLPGIVRQGVLYPLSVLYPKADWLPRFMRAKTTLENLAKSPDEAYYSSVSSVSDKIKAKLLSFDMNKELSDYRSFEIFKEYYSRANCADPLKKIFYVDIKMYLSGDILTKVDLASMAHSLEVRVPILDHCMVEYAFSLPTSFKIQQGTGKYIFKKVVSDLLPDDILYRNKMGFSIPLEKWLRSELAQSFQEEVLKNGNLPYFDYKNIANLYQKHLSGIADYRDPLWNLWVFHRWYKKYAVSPETKA
ncbi:MAG: asparagine synthase (glutamine-hydrolyzing) [Candidatus Brocadiae bacterium]|nr:asparagine synthase (glutamine-hydrolyzing) [Candidatus Brocadiia bacterium]